MLKKRSAILNLAGFLTVAASFVPGAIRAEDPIPVEVGLVDWQRDLDAAIEASQRTGRPVLAFFQEVPGCSGCRDFGAGVMSYTPIVEAIEREFVPVLIYNNRPGYDSEVLDRYDEPAWNYQVIRFLDGSGRDLIPRKDRVWTRDALASRMILALEAANRPVPGYLEATAYEAKPDLQEKVAFAQPCFWIGEVALGRVPGVIRTEAGWIGDHEVTLVHYRPDLVSLDALVDSAATAGVADVVYLASEAQRQRVREDNRIPVGRLDQTYRRARESDQKRQIRGSVFAEIDLTPMQRTKVNAFVTSDPHEVLGWLTPSQVATVENSCRGNGEDGQRIVGGELMCPTRHAR